MDLTHIKTSKTTQQIIADLIGTASLRPWRAWSNFFPAFEPKSLLPGASARKFSAWSWGE